jgi:hypothetical protein
MGPPLTEAEFQWLLLEFQSETFGLQRFVDAFSAFEYYPTIFPARRLAIPTKRHKERTPKSQVVGNHPKKRAAV